VESIQLVLLLIFILSNSSKNGVEITISLYVTLLFIFTVPEVLGLSDIGISLLVHDYDLWLTWCCVSVGVSVQPVVNFHTRPSLINPRNLYAISCDLMM